MLEKQNFAQAPQETQNFDNTTPCTRKLVKFEPTTILFSPLDYRAESQNVNSGLMIADGGGRRRRLLPWVAAVVCSAGCYALLGALLA